MDKSRHMGESTELVYLSILYGTIINVLPHNGYGNNSNNRHKVL